MIKAATGYSILFVLVALLSCCYGSFVHAQGENNVWAFGHGSGLDFNSGKPESIKSNMYALEGCASISDAFGNLLFYTSGNKVWDKNGVQMPNGYDLWGNQGVGSGTQAVLILKSLSHSEEYYLFTLDAQEITMIQTPRLRYSVVNMTLNNGLGDVKPSEKNILVHDEMEERMFAVEADDCGYWIVGHKRHSNVYVAFKLTASGISAPVYSPGIYSSFMQGGEAMAEMKISPDGGKVAIIFHGIGFDDFHLEIGDFDIKTGMISNTIIISQDEPDSYGISFSPDNSKLYLTSNLMPSGKLQVAQYDLASYPNAAAIRNSRTVVFEMDYNDFGGSFKGTRIGPDNKIYVASNIEGYISCIREPNALGMACNFDYRNILMPVPNYFYGYTLGNPTVTATYKDTLPGKYIDTLICFFDSILISAESNLLNYTWNDGTRGASRYVREDGLYYCLSTKECTIRMDTFKVSFLKGSLSLGADTIICPGDSLMLRVSGDGFRWQDGSTDSIYVVRHAGRYRVSIDEKGCSFSDSVQISVYDQGAFIAEGDTLICSGEKLVLHGISRPEGHLTWNTGSFFDSVPVTQSGSYILQAENICGTFFDSVYIAIQDCHCQPFIPNAFSPNGDGNNDEFKVMLDCYPQQFALSVFNRYGKNVFSSYSRDEGWNGIYGSAPADVGAYYYRLQYQTPDGTLITHTGDVLLIR